MSNFSSGQRVGAPTGGNHTVGVDQCQNCGKWSYFEADANGNEIFDTYPKVEIDVDEALPESVKPALREAYQNLESKSWNSCVTMCRRAIEESVDNLGAKGHRLIDKIDDLATKNTITPDLKEWAHEGRLGGNLGAHGSTNKKWADEQDAEEILEFTKWYMRYVYALPKQLADRRANIEQTNTTTS